jgi:DNA-binding winged helix-turn-helix (wHTH) protein/Tfp pilus assembly protein PilF
MLRFGVYELDLARGELRKGGSRVKLRPQAFKALWLIAARRGEVVTREEIQQQLWGTTIVEFEPAINQCIKQIRSALRDNAEAPRYIETVPKVGYRFIAQIETERVRTVSPEGGSLAPGENDTPSKGTASAAAGLVPSVVPDPAPNPVVPKPWYASWKIITAIVAGFVIGLVVWKEIKPTATSANEEAREFCRRGEVLNELGTAKDLESAAYYFEKATRLDPGYARAWVMLSEVWALRAGQGFVSVEEGYQEARKAAERALALDGGFGEAHTALGQVRMIHDWDWVGADESFRRALELMPKDDGVMRLAGSLARYQGHLDEALRLYDLAIKTDPKKSNSYKNQGMNLYYSGQLEEAKKYFNKSLDLSPGRLFVHGYLSQIYLAQSQTQLALSEAKLENQDAYRLLGLALAYHAQGKKKESDAALLELISNHSEDSPYQIAEVYAFRGDRDKAFEWLDRTFTMRDGGLTEVKPDPLMNNLRRDPRFAALLRKMRLPL